MPHLRSIYDPWTQCNELILRNHFLDKTEDRSHCFKRVIQLSDMIGRIQRNVKHQAMLIEFNWIEFDRCIQPKSTSVLKIVCRSEREGKLKQQQNTLIFDGVDKIWM